MRLVEKNPTLSGRQQSILELARQQGRVLVEPLAETLNVTPQTIRRDLSELCRRRLLQRIHGGAITSDGIENLGYDARSIMAHESKTAIGKCAAKLIPNDSSLFINVGTTTEQVAQHLMTHLGLLVISNNLNIVNILRTSENIEVMIAGGSVRHEDGAVVGESATRFIEQFKLDYAIIGVSAVEEDGTVLDFDTREVCITQAIIKNARSVILVADELKFRRKAPVRVCHVAEIDYFVTDSLPSKKFMSVCDAHHVKVKITGT